MRPESGETRPVRLLFVGILLVGAALRVAYLDRQVVLGDELHPVRVAQEQSLGWILTHYRVQDNCIPITACAWLLDRTVGLEELGFRALSWLPGILLVLLALRASRTLLPAADRALLGWLVAASPLLVFWSREARPYAAVSLLGPLALLALVRWAHAGRRSDLLATAAAQAGLLYFNLPSAPFVGCLDLAGIVWGALAAPAGARLRGAWRMTLPGLVALAFTLALVGPALASLREVLGEHEQWGSTWEERPGARTYLDAAQLAFGFSRFHSGSPWQLLLALPAALALLGLWRLCRRHPRVALPALILLAGPALAYASTAFILIERGRVWLRYQAAAIPVLLFLCAYGWSGLRTAVAARWAAVARPLSAIAAALLLAHALAGPLLDGVGPGRPFGLAFSRLFDAEPLTAGVGEGRAPAFYADVPEGAVVVEWPPRHQWFDLYAAYQRMHGRAVMRWQAVETEHPGLAFRTFVFGRENIARRAPRGAFVVLHKDLGEERFFMREGRRPTRADGVIRPTPIDPVLATCRSAFGEPVYEDEWLVVFRNG